MCCKIHRGSSQGSFFMLSWEAFFLITVVIRDLSQEVDLCKWLGYANINLSSNPLFSQTIGQEVGVLFCYKWRGSGIKGSECSVYIIDGVLIHYQL